MLYQSTHFTRADEAFIEKNWEEIYSLCLRLAKRWHNLPRHYEPQDLAQIAAVKVWMAIDKFDADRSLSAFVYSIAYNAFVDACRSRKDMFEFSQDDVLPATLIESENGSSALDMEPLLECLSARQRRVIEMSFGLGEFLWDRTDESIAEELGITRQTVISDRRKALQEIQTRVGRRGVLAA